MTSASQGNIATDTYRLRAQARTSIDGLPNAAVIGDKASPVYFLHIPKTAGTTFIQFLTSRFGEENVRPPHLWSDLLELSPSEIARYGLIRGHFYSYLYRYVPVHLRYLTFLRDPVERALSHYGHVMLHKGHYFHQRAHELGDFGSFLRDAEMATVLSNFQVKSLAFDLDPVDLASTMAAEELSALKLERLLESTRPILSENDMLSVAKRYLEQMCFVIITGRLVESVRLLWNKFEWRSPNELASYNVNASRLSASQLSKTDLALLGKINEAVNALYEFANQLFTGALEQVDSTKRNAVAS